MVQAFDIDKYTPTKKDEFLFDTNVLVFLYNSLNPDINDERIGKYCNFLNKIINAGSKIYITSLNLAEFANVLLKIECGIKKCFYPKGSNIKKQFRESGDYNNALQAIKPIIKSIIRDFEKISDCFDELNIEDMSDNLSIDFNDEYFNYFCNHKELKLVTDDYDYASLNSPLIILSANQKYFKK